MNFYVLNTNDSLTKKLGERLESLLVNPNMSADDLMGYGFTNYNKPNLYWHKIIVNNYDVSFSITINKSTLKIKGMAILDENYMQPYFCNNKIYKAVTEIINKMVSDGIFIEA